MRFCHQGVHRRVTLSSRLTGVGKSTFINAMAGKDTTTVGYDLTPCTTSILPVVVLCRQDPSRRIVFVDTPGLDAMNEDYSVAFRRIVDWLVRSYGDRKKLAGVIYLHDINQPRVSGPSRSHFGMLSELLGDGPSRTVVLTTTKWGDVEDNVGIQREKELSATFWKDMAKLGSTITQFRDDSRSAWRIVDLITERI
ncbi:hypothetical protein BV22DRAFT_437045 [Leucogyrophana mollusca]|uniref:Uncharacterized protein n=1 Tax=Leucogyrophana mollusca TaxID=85980 RepID=A0ACB8BJH3_9AGAM|nr:hypothetical protein BV22DRAFT_437045 [Leucogyrophana mollusca]